MSDESDSGADGTLSQDRVGEIDRVFRTAPFIEQLGPRLARVSRGECESLLTLDGVHLQQDGFVHAGVQATLADHTCGAAAATMIRDGEIVLTAEFKISLLRAARGERLRAVARVLKPGSRLMFAEAEIFCDSGTETVLAAKASVTLAVVPRPVPG